MILKPLENGGKSSSESSSGEEEQGFGNDIDESDEITINIKEFFLNLQDGHQFIKRIDWKNFKKISNLNWIKKIKKN